MSDIPPGFMLCPDCNGNGNGWPEHPTMCGGLPCPICEGVCPTCLGELVPIPDLNQQEKHT